MQGPHVQSLVYSMVARGQVVLADYSAFPSAAASFAALVAACLLNLSAAAAASSNNLLCYKRDAHTFHFLIQDRFGEEIAPIFLQRVKEDFYKRYGDATIDYERFTTCSLQKDYGPRLKEHMQYCFDHSQKLKKLSSIKDQILEVKGIVAENIEQTLSIGESIELKFESMEIFQAHAENFHRQGQQLKKEMQMRQIRLRLLVLFILAIISLSIWLIICKGFEC